MAEELQLPVESVHLVMGDTDQVPFDMGTFGSRTTPTMVPQLRRAAAAARALLHRPGGRAMGRRSRLADRGGRQGGACRDRPDARLRRADAGPEARRDHRRRRDDHACRGVEGRRPVGAQGRWPGDRDRSAPLRLDVERPGMLRGKVLRPPAFGARLASLDTSQAEAMPGVKVVRDGDFVGVVAPNEHWPRAAWPRSGRVDACRRPRRRPIEISRPISRRIPNGPRRRGRPGLATATARRVRTARSRTGWRPLPSRSRRLTRSPTSPTRRWSRAPRSPSGRTASSPSGPARSGRSASAASWRRPFGLPENQVRVIVPDTGSGYGGKHTGEAAVEAARLAKAAGKPVKLVWTREEEFTWAYFRPAGVIETAAGVDKDGTLTAWEFHNYNSGGSGLGTPYECRKSQGRSSTRRLRRCGRARTAPWPRRPTTSPASRTWTSWPTPLGIDPLAFRLKNLEDAAPAGRAGSRRRASSAGARRSPPTGHGFGIAGGTEKGSYVATCAEVAVDRATGARQGRPRRDRLRVRRDRQPRPPAGTRSKAP